MFYRCDIRMRRPSSAYSKLELGTATGQWYGESSTVVCNPFGHRLHSLANRMGFVLLKMHTAVRVHSFVNSFCGIHVLDWVKFKFNRNQNLPQSKRCQHVACTASRYHTNYEISLVRHNFQ